MPPNYDELAGSTLTGARLVLASQSSTRLSIKFLYTCQLIVSNRLRTTFSKFSRQVEPSGFAFVKGKWTYDDFQNVRLILVPFWAMNEPMHYKRMTNFPGITFYDVHAFPCSQTPKIFTNSFNGNVILIP